MKTFLILIVLVLVASVAFAGDIVTVPTANQLKAGQVDVAYYYIGLDNSSPQPTYLQAQTLYFGVTNRIELDVHRYDPEKHRDKTSVILNAGYLVMAETALKPQIVIGGRNITSEKTTNAPVNSKEVSFYVLAAKNVTPMLPGGPKLPLLRLHLGLGTEDWTLLGEKRHDGLFGGAQALLTPELGAVALWDGQDMITGLTFTPKGTSVTIKAGGYGKNWWAGVSYAKNLKFSL